MLLISTDTKIDSKNVCCYFEKIAKICDNDLVVAEWIAR